MHTLSAARPSRPPCSGAGSFKSGHRPHPLVCRSSNSMFLDEGFGTPDEVTRAVEPWASPGRPPRMLGVSSIPAVELSGPARRHHPVHRPWQAHRTRPCRAPQNPCPIGGHERELQHRPGDHHLAQPLDAPAARWHPVDPRFSSPAAGRGLLPAWRATYRRPPLGLRARSQAASRHRPVVHRRVTPLRSCRTRR